MLEAYKLALEYIKVLIWPSILVGAFALHGDKLFEIVENREIDAFGLKIGKEIEDISKNYEAQISLLKAEIKQLNGSEALLDKVEGIEDNLGKQLEHVRTSALQQQSSLESLSVKQKVEHFERSGFEAIIARDIHNAIQFFADARRLWPDYHNVSEINRLLNKHKSTLQNSRNNQAWNEVIDIILARYSWGMPADIREKLSGQP